MRSPRRILQLGLVALIAALIGLWAPVTRAHQPDHAARGHDCVEIMRAVHAPAAGDRETAGVERPQATVWGQPAGDREHIACASGCCAGGASCASAVAGAPADGVILPEPGRLVFEPGRIKSPRASPHERLPKPPRA